MPGRMNGMNRVRKNFTTLFLVICLGCLLTAGVSAATITTSKDTITTGDLISIPFSDLKDNTKFSLLIHGSFPVTPGGPFSFEANTFQIPFTLKTGTIHADLKNTDSNIFAVKKGDTEVRRIGKSTSGSYSTTESYNISAGTFDYITASGTAAPGANVVVVNLEMTGLKAGPDSGEISFLVGGVQSGTVSLTARENDNVILQKTITVRSSSVSATRTTTPAAFVAEGQSANRTPARNTTNLTVQPSPVNTTVTTVKANLTRNETIPVIRTAIPSTSSATTQGTTKPVPTKAAMGIMPFLFLLVITGFLVVKGRK